MDQKIRLGLMFGGQSVEHEVSLQSVKSIISVLDKNKYELLIVGVGKDGIWRIYNEDSFLLNPDDPKQIKLNDQAGASEPVVLQIGGEKGLLVKASNGTPLGTIDVVFPIIHGSFGEDGVLQGLMKSADIPFVGAGILGSAIGMDKDVAKRLLRDAGIPIAQFVTLHHDPESTPDFASIKDQLGLPMFVKPANSGSSVGITKVNDEGEFQKAVAEAFKYDNKIMIEEAIAGRELECSVLGNEKPEASVPGEVIAHDDFYSYNAKYVSADGADLKIPAELPKEIADKIRKLSIATYNVLCCEGMARVDLFMKENGSLVVNEINTIPGFTKISMYPKLWEASGIQYPELIDKLIQLALERHAKETQIKTDFY